jgi:crotonobetainyl-CoA:carnitine CoA-transferase CaiB-like acyl-CoA transferase
MTGYQAAIGILAALRHRDLTGEGQHVEVDMFSVVLDAQLQELVTYLNTGSSPRRTEERTAHGSIPAPYGVYQTADGWMTLSMAPLSLLGEVLDDDWLRSLTHYNDGHRYRDEVYSRIRPSFTTRTTAEWIEICDRHNVWAGPVLDYAAVAADPHVLETGMIVEQPDPRGGVVRTIRPPLRLSETNATIRRGAPILGADTASILAELGYDEGCIDGLLAAGTVASD